MSAEELTLKLECGGAALSWELTTLTDAPEGKFLALDADAQPRLIIDGEELAELQASIVEGQQ